MIAQNTFQRVIDYDLITIAPSGGHVSVNPFMPAVAKNDWLFTW